MSKNHDEIGQVEGGKLLSIARCGQIVRWADCNLNRRSPVRQRGDCKECRALLIAGKIAPVAA